MMVMLTMVQTKEGGRPRATLLITDRSMDTIAPFVHEFTYQAMVNDVLPIEDGTRYKCVHPHSPTHLRPES